MRLLKVDSLEEARNKMVQAARNLQPEAIHCEISEALGMTLAQDLIAKESVPSFRKSTVDGYAVVAKDTTGASETIPAFLLCVDEVEMGKKADVPIVAGQCVYVPTGGMLPDGADAVVMVEHCEPFGQEQIAVYDSVSSGRNVIGIGDDIPLGAGYLNRGTRLRPQEIGVLASMGILEVPVVRPWRVTILSTGDELVSPEHAVEMGQIRDSNSFTAAAQCKKYGFEVLDRQLIPDDDDAIRAEIIEAKKSSDVLIISGGSSQGKKDMTASLLDEQSDPGVFTHGIAVKPGKPTILGFDEASNTILVGLPGHPVAAMLIFELLLGWLWQSLCGTTERKTLPAIMDTNVAGGAGRTLCMPVQLSSGPKGWMATPILGNSGLLSTLTRADGYALIGANQEGLNVGDVVQVTLL